MFHNFNKTTHKSVPIHNLFNRTCIFQPLDAKSIYMKDGMTRDNHYKDTLYDVRATCLYLNCSFDYMLAAIFFAKFVTNYLNKIAEPEVLVFELNKLYDIFNANNSKPRVRPKSITYEPYRKSLHRLQHAHLKYKLAGVGRDIEINSTIIQDDCILDFKNNSLTVTVGKLITDIYDSTYTKKSEFKYLNIEHLFKVKAKVDSEKEGCIALLKYLYTHDYIDFTMDRLSRVLGYHYRLESTHIRKKQGLPKSRETLAQEYLKRVLKSLKDKGYVMDWHYFEKIKRFRILLKGRHPDVKTEQDMLDLESNIDEIKVNKAEEKTKEKARKNKFKSHPYDDDLPF